MDIQKVLDIILFSIGTIIFFAGIITKIWEICAIGIFVILTVEFGYIVERINKMEKKIKKE